MDDDIRIYMHKNLLIKRGEWSRDKEQRYISIGYKRLKQALSYDNYLFYNNKDFCTVLKDTIDEIDWNDSKISFHMFEKLSLTLNSDILYHLFKYLYIHNNIRYKKIFYISCIVDNHKIVRYIIDNVGYDKINIERALLYSHKSKSYKVASILKTIYKLDDDAMEIINDYASSDGRDVNHYIKLLKK